MATLPDTPGEELAKLHQEWEAIHERLRVQERLLSDAVALYARGQGPRPEVLMVEVEQMRAECAQRFRALMNALKSPSEA